MFVCVSKLKPLYLNYSLQSTPLIN